MDTTSQSAKRILIVEDEQFLRDLYVEILETAGYSVDQAEEGKKALAYLQKGGYDLVLLDIMLPNIDGFKILEELQVKPPEKPNNAIIILTNLGKDANIAKGISLGAKGYMIKADYTPDQILNEVKNYMS